MIRDNYILTSKAAGSESTSDRSDGVEIVSECPSARLLHAPAAITGRTSNLLRENELLRAVNDRLASRVAAQKKSLGVLRAEKDLLLEHLKCEALLREKVEFKLNKVSKRLHQALHKYSSF